MPGMATAPTTLGERLARARKEAKLSQEEVARRVGIAQPSYSELERGVSLSTTKIGSLAHVLNVDAYWLETGNGSFERTVREGRAAYPSLAEDEYRVLALYKGLPARKRKALIELISE